MSVVRANTYQDASGGSNAVFSGVASPPGSMGNRNRIINGNMVIDQRNAGASVTQNTAGIYTVDRWQAYGAAASKFTVQRNAGSVTPPAGFTNYLGCTSSSAYSAGASEGFTISQAIEGFNVADLGWGAAGAQSVTLSFWVRSSLTGTFGGVIQNNAQNRTYPFPFAISAANTWEQKSVTIPGDTSGTWLTDNGIGIRVYFSLGAGSTWSGAAGSWSGSFFLSATGATSVVATNGATFNITGVQLEAGSVATPFEQIDYGRELMLCQRYYQRIQGDTTAQRGVGGGVVGSGTQVFRVNVPMKVSMRSAPTCTASGLTAYDGTANPAVSLSTGYQTTDQISFDVSGGSGLTVGRAGMVLTGGSSTSYFDASAEL